MTALLDAAPTAAPADDTADLIRWATSLTLGERDLALAASDMPTRRVDRNEALGKPRGGIPIPANPRAAATAAAWIAQGVERLGGELRVWQLDRDRRNANEHARRTGDFSRAKAFDKAHGGRRLGSGVGYSLTNWAGQASHPDRRQVLVWTPADDGAMWGAPMTFREARMRAELAGARLVPRGGARDENYEFV
ncbi:hypothetical protein [Nocardiopsis baichengensis]|uniref:hypothetical protein n=1 Tax=Nocardiopsis baichengensis TaxID=280240 RepID=UPI000380BC4D|nr:hypothetical protein [Nocardiopsis baichengensis]